VCVCEDTAREVFGVRTQKTRAVDELEYCKIIAVNKSPLYMFVHRRLLISVIIRVFRLIHKIWNL